MLGTDIGYPRPTAPATGVARRADYGAVRLGQRDIDGLILCAEHGGAPYDLLAAALAAQPARLRGVVARWRKAGYAATPARSPGGPSRTCGPCSATPSTPGTWSTGGTATATATASPYRPSSGYGHPSLSNPALIDRDTWDLTQTISAGHGTSRDGDGLNTHPATIRFYPYRGRVRCRDCQRRMAGNTYNTASQVTYYRCPHNWASPKHAADHPDHPRTVQVPQNR